MKLKDITVKVKAGPDAGLGEGQFSAYASVFGNTDSYGDVVVRGAFADDLAGWKASGNPIPVYWGHRMDGPFWNLGHVLEATEDDHGLLVTAQLDLENENAKYAYRLLKGGRVNQMSFAYDVLDGGPVTREEKSVYELRKLKLYEVSVVPVGANQETEILAVKAAQQAELAKAGRVLSQSNYDQLRGAYDQIGGVLAAADKAPTEQGKATDQGPVKDEEPVRAKSEEPSPMSSADSWLVHIRLSERRA